VVFFDLPFIPNIKGKFSNSWGQGFVQIKQVEHVHNIGAYISKYFSKLWFDKRVEGTKGYFASTRLFQPEIFRSLDILKQYAKLDLEYVETYDSQKFGQIKYSQLKIKHSL